MGLGPVEIAQSVQYPEPMSLKKKKAKQCMLIILKLGTQRQEDPWYFLTSHLNLFGKLQSSKKSCLKILQVKKKKKF